MAARPWARFEYRSRTRNPAKATYTCRGLPAGSAARGRSGHRSILDHYPRRFRRLDQERAAALLTRLSGALLEFRLRPLGHEPFGGSKKAISRPATVEYHRPHWDEGHRLHAHR